MDFTVFNMSFNNLTLVIGLITGILLTIITYIFWEYQKFKFQKMVIKKYRNENIIYKITPGKWIMLIIQFLIGVTIGGYILPFFIFENITKIKMVTSSNLTIFLIWALWGVIVSALLGAYSIILTDKRILALYPYGFFYNTDILIKDIKEIKIEKHGIVIIKKDNSIFPIGPQKLAMKIYTQINNLLKEKEVTANE